MQFGSIHWELQASLLVTHVQWPIFLTGLELICDFYGYFLEEGRSCLVSQLLFLLVVSVSHGDVSLGVPSCIAACTAPSREAREFRCRVQNVGPYQATTPQSHSRLGTGIPCTRRRSNSGSVCETFRVVISTMSSTVRACEFH